MYLSKIFSLLKSLPYCKRWSGLCKKGCTLLCVCTSMAGKSGQLILQWPSDFIPCRWFFFFPQQLVHVFMRHSFVQKAVLLKMLNLLVGVFENSGLGRCREDCSQHSNTVLFTWTDMELQDLCFRIVYRVDVAWGNKQRSSQYVLILLENEWWGVILFFSILAEIEESSMMVCTGRLILWLPLFFFFPSLEWSNQVYSLYFFSKLTLSTSEKNWKNNSYCLSYCDLLKIGSNKSKFVLLIWK